MLLISILRLSARTLRHGKAVYQGDMTPLCLVDAIILPLDMADPKGMRRVTTFMGLGRGRFQNALIGRMITLCPLYSAIKALPAAA